MPMPSFMLPTYINKKYHSGGRSNAGNQIQTMAIENAVSTVFPHSYFWEHDLETMSEYRSSSKKIYLTQGWFAHTDGFMPSSSLIPVYLGMHLAKYKSGVLQKFSQKHPDYWTSREIGCRDRYTLQICHELGLPSYLSRCLTLTFPKRRFIPKHKKVVLNLDTTLIEMLPEEIRSGATIVSQVGMDKDPELKVREHAHNLIKEYAEASLVVTDRVHAASPATALGTPTVLFCQDQDKANRMSFLTDLLPVWTLDDLKKGNVDYAPTAPDIELLKN